MIPKAINRVLLIMLSLCVLVVLSNSPLAAQGTLFVEGGNVGIGIATPSFDLHVIGSDGSTQARIAETSSTAAARNIFTLQNNGGVKFTMFNSLNNSTWSFSAQENFNIDLVDAPGNEFQVQGDGDVVIKGTLTENSSRLIKEHFKALDQKQILRRVAQLPISSWQYTYDTANARHVGPVAEDFFAAFGLGPDNQHISPSDKAGIAMVAIQGLYQELEDRDAEILQLKAENSALQGRMENLEKIVNELLTKR